MKDGEPEGLDPKQILGKTIVELANESGESGRDHFEALLLFSRKLLDLWGVQRRFETWHVGSHTQTNKKPNLIFGNHPGSIDVPLVLTTLHDLGILDPEVQILVSEISYPFYTRNFGHKNFVEASKRPTVISESLRRVSDNLNRGGQFLIFPADRTLEPQGKILFKGGLRFILSQVGGDRIVNSFYIDSDYQGRILSRSPEVLTGILHRLRSDSTELPVVPQVTIGIKRTESLLGQWQEDLNTPGGDMEVGRALSRRFLDEYGLQ